MSPLQFSKQFHNADVWEGPGRIPGINTLSETVRVGAAIGLSSVYASRVLAYGTITAGQSILQVEFTHMKELTNNAEALAYNVMMVGYGCFAAIPVLGNIPPWMSFYAGAAKIIGKAAFR